MAAPLRPLNLPLGWTLPSRVGPAIGFHAPRHDTKPSCLLEDTSDGHLLTCAPTGAGKGVSAVIPALLSYPGPILAIDLKSELYHVTARRRREMGHRVVRLDPFQISGRKGDTLNPFDLIDLPGSDPDCDVEMLVELMAGGTTAISKDMFWDMTGRSMLVGVAGYVNERPVAERNIGKMLDLLYGSDVDYNLAVLLDKDEIKSPLAKQELAGYLSHEADKCRPSVRSTAQSFVKSLGSQRVRTVLAKSTFALTDWLNGEPMDIYLVFPPDKLERHRGLLRLIIGTLLATLTRRQTRPKAATLLLLDECAQLGTMPHLRAALTLLRGYGVKCWTFWQDISQLRHYYPTDWESILNNSSIMQVFGTTNGWMAKVAAELLGVPLNDLLTLPKDEQLLLRPGEAATRYRRVDYLKDAIFAGLFDANPRHVSESEKVLPRKSMQEMIATCP